VIVDVKGHLSELRLAAASLARRQSCYNLCERLLREELTASDISSMDDVDESAEPPTIFALASRSASRPHESDADLSSRRIRAHRDVAKLLYGRAQTQDAIELMTTISCDSVTSRQKSTASVRELSARSLLSLSKWLQADSRLATQYTSLLHMSEQIDADTFTGRLNTLVNMARTSEADKPSMSIELSPMDRR